MKILKQVNSKERLPNVDDWYFVTNDGHTCNNAHLHYELPNKEWYDREGNRKNQPTHWYEKVDVKLKSEEILPLCDRLPMFNRKGEDTLECTLNFLDNFNKALETAELENAEWRVKEGQLGGIIQELVVENQGLKLAIENNHGGNCIIAPKKEVDKIAKERYDKAEGYMYKQFGECNRTTTQALKIAAGL